MNITLDQNLRNNVRNTAMKVHNGFCYVSAKAVSKILEGTDYTLDGYTGQYVVRFNPDDGIYGRGKTPVDAVAWACQMFPLARTQILGY